MAESGYSDGSVVVSTDLDTQGFEAGSKNLKNAISSLNGKFNSLGATFQSAMNGNANSVIAFEARAAVMESIVSKLRSSMEDLASEKKLSQEYIDFSKSVDKAEAALFKLYDKKDKLEELGVDKQSRTWKGLMYDINNAEEALERLESRKKALESSGEMYISGADTSEYQKMNADLSRISDGLNEYEAKIRNAHHETSKLAILLKGVGTVGVGAFKTLGKAVSRLHRKFRSFNKSSNSTMAAVKKLTKVFTSFGARIKSMLRRRLISSIISGATTGIKNLVQISPQLNTAISSVMSALSRLKNSFATAFAPIITAVSPILTMLIDLLSEAFTKLGMFISALTGAASFKKAVKVQEDYAQSLNDTSKAADKANKSVAGFDELNNTSSQENTDESSGTKPADMFEDVPIESKIVNFAKRLKDAFLNGDYEGIGSLIADKFNGIVQKINNAVRWDNVGPRITAFVDGLTRTFNSIVDNVNWRLIGDTVAQGVNTIVNSLYLLVTGIDWSRLGKSLMDGLNGLIHGINWGKLGQTIGSMFQSAISFLHAVVHNFDFKALAKGLADGLNGMVSSIDWAMLGDTISTAIRNAFQFISEAVKAVDWKKLGEDIATFLNSIDWVGIFTDLAAMLSDLLSGALDLLIGFAENLDWAKLGNDIWNALVGIITSIDWSGLFTKAFELIGAALGGATQLLATFFTNLWEAIKSAYYSVKDYFAQRVKDAGGDLGEGILLGLAEAFLNIGLWVREHVFKPFIDGFCSIFGIHSPSTVMAEMGGYIIQGLKNGISSAWIGIKTFFSNAWQGVKNICIGAWNGIKSACKSAWSNVTGTISDACTNIKNWVSDKFTTAKNAVSDTVSTIRNKVSEGFSNAWSVVSDKVSNIKNSIVTGFSSAYSVISSKVSSIKSSISTGFSNVYSTVSSKVTSIKTSIANGFSSMYSTVSNAASNIFSSVSSTFSDLVSDAWTWGADICSNIANGISSLAGDVWDSVESLAGDIADFLGFSEPEKGPLSRFHTFMPDMIDLMTKGIKENKTTAINAVADLAQGIADEAQDTSVLIPIDTENKYTNFLNSFSDKITDAFMDLINKLEAIAGGVTFAVPAIAEGTVLPYKLNQSGYEDNESTSTEKLFTKLDDMSRQLDELRKLDDIVDAIDSKETGVTDEAVYNSVKQSVRKETKATGRNPFSS